VLSAASSILTAGGEEALQMKDLAERAEVSLATLYRYFPSKDHVLLALALSSYEAEVNKVLSEPVQGGTARERVTSHLLREFRSQQRDPRRSGAIANVLARADPAYADFLETIRHLHMRTLRHVAGPMTEQQRQLLPIIVDNFASATRHWRTGMGSAADARFQIRIGCHLLDLSAEQVDEEQEQAAIALPTAVRH
jgi:AcrR family transcriptional regulator